MLGWNRPHKAWTWNSVPSAPLSAPEPESRATTLQTSARSSPRYLSPRRGHVLLAEPIRVASRCSNVGRDMVSVALMLLQVRAMRCQFWSTAFWARSVGQLRKRLWAIGEVRGGVSFGSFRWRSFQPQATTSPLESMWRWPTRRRPPASDCLGGPE